MDLDPLNGNSIGCAFPHQREARVILEHLVMAIHAGGTARNIRVPGLFHSVVAIAAVDPELAGMGRVRKGHWLHRLIADLRVFRREVIPGASNDSAPNQNQSDKYQTWQPVGPFRENR